MYICTLSILHTIYWKQSKMQGAIDQKALNIDEHSKAMEGQSY